MKTLDLVLIPCGDGFSYEWQAANGRVMCCGWAAGTRAEAVAAATEHLGAVRVTDIERLSSTPPRQDPQP